jgi:hypothetical protein
MMKLSACHDWLKLGASDPELYKLDVALLPDVICLTRLDVTVSVSPFDQLADTLPDVLNDLFLSCLITTIFTLAGFHPVLKYSSVAYCGIFLYRLRPLALYIRASMILSPLANGLVCRNENSGTFTRVGS